MQSDEHDGRDDAAPPAELERYITPAGHARFRAEYRALRTGERPRIVEIVAWAAGNGDRSENGDYQYGKRRLREIDRRLRFLDRRLRHAIVVDPSLQSDRTGVFFGATVTFIGPGDRVRTVTVIGVDEAETARGEVSLAAPVARALLGRRVGDEVELHTPGERVTVEVTAIDYPAPPSPDEIPAGFGAEPQPSISSPPDQGAEPR